MKSINILERYLKKRRNKSSCYLRKKGLIQRAPKANICICCFELALGAEFPNSGKENTALTNDISVSVSTLCTYLSAITVDGSRQVGRGASNTDKRGRGVIAEADLSEKGHDDVRTRVKPRAEIPLNELCTRLVRETRQRDTFEDSLKRLVPPVSQSTFQPDTDAIQSGERGRRDGRERKVASPGKNAFPRDLVFRAWIIDVSPRFLSVDRNELEEDWNAFPRECLESRKRTRT